MRAVLLSAAGRGLEGRRAAGPGNLGVAPPRRIARCDHIRRRTRWIRIQRRGRQVVGHGTGWNPRVAGLRRSGAGIHGRRRRRGHRRRRVGLRAGSRQGADGDDAKPVASHFCLLPIERRSVHTGYLYRTPTAKSPDTRPTRCRRDVDLHFECRQAISHRARTVSPLATCVQAHLEAAYRVSVPIT